MSPTLKLKAPAKVNLTLEVLGRRHDGYHDVASVMQTVDLWDVVALELHHDLVLECDRRELETEDNLALQAARLLQREAGVSYGARIRLEKRIPVAAGLGGGSSDAAAVLRGLNRLWGLGLSRQRLLDLAARLGSDVPFFLYGGTAAVHGRGERVRPLPPAPLGWLVLVCPAIRMPDKTAALYRRLGPSHYTGGGLSRKLEARIRGGGDVPPQLLFNVFDAVAFDAYPDLREYWDGLYRTGAREIHLTGSGPTLFAPVARREVGTAIHLLLRHSRGWETYLVSAYDPSREVQA